MAPPLLRKSLTTEVHFNTFTDRGLHLKSVDDGKKVSMSVCECEYQRDSMMQNHE